MENGPDPKRKLVTSLINHYEPDAVVDDAYYESISKKHPNTDTLVSKLISHYEPDSEVTTEYLSGLYSKYGVTEKKNVVGASQPSPLRGLGGSSDGSVPSPLSPQEIQQKSKLDFGTGNLDRATKQKPITEYPTKGLEVPKEARVPDKPFTSQLTSLPPVEFHFNANIVKPSAVSDPRKLTQEIEKAALSQAGLNPDEFKKKANDAIRQKEAGEVEMEMYVVDGKAIPSEQFKDLIFDQKFIEDTQKGLHNVQINPSNSEYTNQFLDKKLVDTASRNLQSGTRTGDKWESFMSGASRVASGVAGLETMYYDVVEEVLGLPLRRDLFGVSELQEDSEELARKSEEYQKKTFEYRDNFLKSILNGNYSDAVQQAGDATSASIPNSAGAAALSYAGGPALAFAVLAPMSSSAEYASMKVSEDEAFTQLSRAEKLLRSNVVGPLEAATDLVAVRAISRSFDLTKSLYKGLVKEVAEKQGLDAAEKAAKELSKSVIRKYGENIGLQMTEEFFAEGGSTAATMLYDDLMGIRSYNAKDYISETLNSGLLGAASGGITTGALSGPAAIYATGLTAKDKLKSVFDRKLYEDPTAVESLSKRVDSMKVPNEVKEDLKNNLVKRKKAVNAVPDNLVEDTEVVDDVQKKQELEEKKRNLDPVFAKPIEEEIAKIDEKLAKVANEPNKEESVSYDNLNKQREIEKIKRRRENDKKQITVSLKSSLNEPDTYEAFVFDSNDEISKIKGVDKNDVISKIDDFYDAQLYDLESKTTTPIEPVVFSTPTDEKYASVNNNDGKGTIDLTKQEYLDWQAKNKPVTEQLTTSKTEQNAKEQQSEQMREQGVQEQPQGKSDSNMPIVNQAELQDGKAPKEEVVGVGGDVKDYKGIFNPKKTGISGLDVLLKDDGYNYFYKGVSGEVVMMSPDEYLKRVREGLKTKEDANIIEDKKDAINEAINEGNKIDMPFISTKDGKFSQEGRNRAVVARERGEKLIPVFIEKDVSFDDKIAKGQEYINSAIKDGATTKEEVLSKLEKQGLHRDAIRFIDNNFDDKSVEQSLKETPQAGSIAVGEDVESRRNKQLEIINKTNPAPNNYNTWIRKVEDIKTADEVFEVAKKEGAMYPDFTEEQMQDALDSGEITIYSSNPIENGVFVTPSKMNAQEYAGGKGGKLYSKKVKLEDIAWIDESEGQYAVVEQPQAEPAKEAPKKPVSESKLNKPFAESFGVKTTKLPTKSKALGITLGGVNVGLSDVDANTVKLEGITTPEEKRNQGKAKAALKKITEEADKQNKTITLEVVPEEGVSTEEGLRKLYEGFGFVATEGKTMVRKPNVEVAAEKNLDVNGNNILTAEEWNRLSKEEQNKIKGTITGKVSDKSGNTFSVDYNLAGPLQKIINAGYSTGQSDSGTVSDHPNYRYVEDSRIGKYKTGDVIKGGSGAYLTFWKPTATAVAETGRTINTEEQIDKIRKAATEAGFVVKDSNVMGQPSITIRLPFNETGISQEEVLTEASQLTNEKYPGLKEKDFLEWLDKRSDELRPIADKKNGGEKKWTDKEIISKWNQLADNLSKEEATPVETQEIVSQEQDIETDILLSGEAQARRDKGEYTKDGVTHKRNKEDKGQRGSKGTVRFTQKVEVPFTYKLVEAESLQPSHMNGRRNPNHFLPEAQPKSRNDDGSIAMEDAIAKDPRLDLVSGDTDAYGGAPIVNSRNEVVQGNNRSAGLKKGYANGNPKYKEQLAAEAESFGFTKEQVEGMKNPILVREVAGTDQFSIELGNYDVKDLESGGKTGIDPIATARRIPISEKGKITQMLFSDGTATLRNAIRDGYSKLADMLSPYVNESQKNSLRTDNPSTKTLMDIEALVRQFLFDGGDPNLSQMFDGLSARQQASIDKAMPVIFSTSLENSLATNVQNAITALSSFQLSGVNSFNAWVNQSDVFNDGKRPSETFSNVEIDIARILSEATNEIALKAKLQEYATLVNGTEGGLFDEAIKPISKEDAINQAFPKRGDGKASPEATKPKKAAPPKKPREQPQKEKPVAEKTDIDKRLEALKAETSKKADLAAEIAALKKSLWEDLNKQGFAQTPKQQGKDDAEFTNKLIQLAKLSIQQGLLSAADFIKEVLANYTGYRSKEEVTQMASDAFNEAKSEFDGNPPKKKRKSSSEMAKERKATSENEPKKQKKKAVVNRGVEGITSEEIKDALENTGLLYIVESHKEAAEIADDFIQRVGFNAALQAVRSETSGLTGAPKAILWGRLIDQVQETLDTETDPIEIVKLTSYIATLVDEFGIEAKKAGQFSSAMQFVYANSSFGYSLESQKSRYKAANNGVIEPAVQELFEQYDKQLKDVKNELIDVYEKLKEANEKAAFENLKNDLELDGEVSMPKPKMTAEARRKADKAIAVVRDIRTRIKANNYSDAVGITAAIDFGLGVIENGIEAGISVAEAIENGIAAIDNLMKDAQWKRDAFRKDVTKEFAKNNINTSSPKKKGQDPSDKGPTGIPRELLYALIKEEGINNIEDLTNAVMEELEIENTEENHRKTRDKITNYGKTRVATEGVAAELAKMTEIGRLISAIEDVQSGKRSKKSGFQRDAPSQKVREMRRQLRELTKNLPMDEHDNAKYHKTALDAIKTRLRNKIADLTTERDTGIRLAKSSGKTTEYDAEANDLLEQIKILQIAHDEVFQKGVMSDEQRVELAITKLENAEKKFQHNIDVKNFTPPTREPEPDDPRVVAAREKMEAKKKEFKEAQIASGEVDSPEVIALERKVEAKKKAIQNLREKLFTGKIQPTTRTATGLVSQELIDLQKEHKDYLDQLNRARQAAKPRRSPEVIATENAVKAAERQLREIEDRIFNNQLDDITKQSKVIQTAQLQFAKQKLADRKAFLRELQEQAGIPEKKRLEALKEAAKNRIAVMQERMKTSQYEKGKYKVKNGVVGAFTPLEKKKSPIDQELQDLLIKEMKIKEAYDVEVYRAELKNRSWPKKILDTAVEVSGLTRAVMATGEMSGVLIQGGKMLASHPQMTSRAIAEMFKQFASAKRAEDFINAVKSSEMYPELKAVKLAITDATQEGKLLAAEEAFVGGYVRHLWNAIGFPLKAIPGKPKLFTPYDWVKAGLTGNYTEPQSAYERWKKLNPNEAFSRAQSGLLNYIRLSRYTQGRNMLIAQGKTFESHPEEYKDIAAYVNRATGRGGLGIAEPLAKPLSILLFSARNWASVMADVTPLVAYHYAKTGTSKNPFKPSVTQKMFRWDYLTWLGATASLVGLYMIASGDDEEDDRPKVELDPRSSNFMKMRVGNTYIDIFSGRQQMVVFQSRMLSNSIKNGTSNKVYNLGQSSYTPTRGKLAVDLVRGKSTPTFSMFYKWLAKSTNSEGMDTDEFGQPYDATQNLIDNAYPMYWGTISELYEEQPDLVATALTGAAFFGLGAQTYGQNIGPVERAYLKIENEKRDKVTAVNEETSKKIDKEFEGQFITKNNILKYELDYLTQYRKSLGESPKKEDKTDVFNSIIEKHNAEVFKQSASKELIEVSMNMGKESMRKPELIAKKLIDAEMYPMDENTKKLLKGALTVSEYQKMNSTLTEHANWKASQKQAANKKSLSSSLSISLKSIFSN